MYTPCVLRTPFANYQKKPRSGREVMLPAQAVVPESKRFSCQPPPSLPAARLRCHRSGTFGAPQPLEPTILPAVRSYNFPLLTFSVCSHRFVAVVYSESTSTETITSTFHSSLFASARNCFVAVAYSESTRYRDIHIPLPVVPNPTSTSGNDRTSAHVWVRIYKLAHTNVTLS